jgi:hypothetical protein
MGTAEWTGMMPSLPSASVIEEEFSIHPPAMFETVGIELYCRPAFDYHTKHGQVCAPEDGKYHGNGDNFLCVATVFQYLLCFYMILLSFGRSNQTIFTDASSRRITGAGMLTLDCMTEH